MTATINIKITHNTMMIGFLFFFTIHDPINSKLHFSAIESFLPVPLYSQTADNVNSPVHFVDDSFPHKVTAPVEESIPDHVHKPDIFQVLLPLHR